MQTDMLIDSKLALLHSNSIPVAGQAVGQLCTALSCLPSISCAIEINPTCVFVGQNMARKVFFLLFF